MHDGESEKYEKWLYVLLGTNSFNYIIPLTLSRHKISPFIMTPSYCQVPFLRSTCYIILH